MNRLLSLIIFFNLTSSIAYGQQWTTQQLERANTAKNASYLTEEEKEIIFLHNLVRMDGALFAKTYLAAHTPYDASNWYVRTLYEELPKIKNLPLLYPSECLTRAARYHAEDIGRTGGRGHDSSNGESFGNRLKRYCPNYNGWSENCDYGYYSSLKHFIRFLVDEDVPSLGHRKNILHKDYNKIGVGFEKHSVYGENCVIDYGSEEQKPAYNQPRSESSTTAQKPAIEMYVGQWTKQQLERANTAKNASYLTEEEKEIIFLHNLVRMDGALFAKTYLAAHTPYDASNWYVKTLYEELPKIKNLPLLYPSECLTRAARYHAEDMGRTGQTGHESSNGESCGNRLKRYCPKYNSGENCAYGYYNAIDNFIGLLVDEDVPSLGHRKNILHKDYNKIGVGFAKHSIYRMNCVIDYGIEGQKQAYNQPRSVSSNNQSRSTSSYNQPRSVPSYNYNNTSSSSSGETMTALGRYWQLNGRIGITPLRYGISAEYNIDDRTFDFVEKAELLTFRLWMGEFAALAIRYNQETDSLYWEPQTRLCVPIAKRCALIVNSGLTFRYLPEQERFDPDFFVTFCGGFRLSIFRFLLLDYKLGYNGKPYTSLDMAIQIPCMRYKK